MKKIIVIVLISLPVYASSQLFPDDVFRNVFHYIGTYCSKDKRSPVTVKSNFLNMKSYDYEYIESGISDFDSSTGILWAGINYALADMTNLKLKNYKNIPNIYIVIFAKKQKADINKLNLAYNRMFSVKLYKKFVKIKNRNSLSPYLTYYNKDALSKLFDKLYHKPDSILAGYKTQTIYDTVFKNMVHKNVNRLMILLNNPEVINIISKKFYKEVTENPSFNSNFFLTECNKIFKINPDYEKDLTGMVIRRNIDGTLPFILQKLLVVLHDYDIEYYKKVKNTINTFIERAPVVSQ